MTGSYRLTFNKPAVAQLLVTDGGEAADGLKVRIEDGSAQFLPVRGSKDGDVIQLDARSRGGVEATVEGSMAEDLAKALENDSGPFHTMHRAAHGWLGVSTHDDAAAPSKFVPHVRVWEAGVTTKKPAKGAKPAKAGKSGKNKSADVTVAPVNGNTIGDMFDYLRDAKALADEYAQNSKRGLPPREIRDARMALAQFEQMAIDFLPEITEAHAILHRVVSRGADAEPVRNEVPRTRKPRKRATKATRTTATVSEAA
jgi:hypothetical protein